ncbi:uncharacterized protein LOC131858884 [Cryptomeria japonica]|uniref:uncharacterized protein LOC131858884 n=1 Tax=Cryptomeria japonica TaxID=3369 RepID=UPI0027DA78AB|nr:uncharacterized protein LOC131858884 [Cryptomeria japonica]
MEGWWKINFDAASKGNLGLFGTCFIVRDWKGDVVALGVKKLDDGTNNVAEALVALTTIRFGKSLGAMKIHLEGDSLIIIHAIMKGRIYAWHLQNPIAKIMEELSFFKDLCISNVRSGNMEVDTLSKWALTFEAVGELRTEHFRHISLEEFDDRLSG